MTSGGETTTAPGRSDRVEALRRLLDRLTAPDLTLDEARVLRSCLPGLLGADAGAAVAECPAPGPGASAAA